MGRRRKSTRRTLISCQISDEFHKFLTLRKQDRREPLYAVADRIMELYKLSDKADLEEKTEKQAEVIRAYYNRIKELEEPQKKLFH